MIQTQQNGEKPLFRPDLHLLGPNSSHKFFFSKVWFYQSLDIMVSYHHVQYQKKNNSPIFRKLIDGRTEGQTDGRTDGRTDRQTRQTEGRE